MIRLVVIIGFGLCSLGCFYYPTKGYQLDAREIGVNLREHTLPVEGGDSLEIWELLPEGTPSKEILFLHGNAGNNLEHLPSVLWLVDEGMRVWMLDYRGFGDSTGTPRTKDNLSDIRAFADYVKTQNLIAEPVLFAQSIGATLAFRLLTERTFAENFERAVLDSPFSSYRKIVQEKIVQAGFLFWPFYPLSFLVSDETAPLQVESPPALPILLVHGKNDEIVSFEHGIALSELLNAESYFFEVPEVGHIQAFQLPKAREIFLRFLRSS